MIQTRAGFVYNGFRGRNYELARFRRINLGFVFQDFNLLDTLTISENIALALTINKVPAAKIDTRVESIARTLSIADILDKYPYVRHEVA